MTGRSTPCSLPVLFEIDTRRDAETSPRPAGEAGSKASHSGKELCHRLVFEVNAFCILECSSCLPIESTSKETFPLQPVSEIPAARLSDLDLTALVQSDLATMMSEVHEELEAEVDKENAVELVDISKYYFDGKVPAVLVSLRCTITPYIG